MAELEALIPEIWSARFQANLDKHFVFGNAINRDYQADAQYGAKIDISKLGAVSVGAYTKNTDFASGAETLTTSDTSITINRQRYFNFQIDSIDEAQSKPNIMNEAMMRAGYAMANDVDAYIAGLHASATTKVGTTAAPKTPVVGDVYGYLTDLAKSLDKLNVPTYDRYLIMGPAGIKLLKDSGEMLSDTAMGDTVRTFGQFGGNGGALPAGYKGHIAGFDLWMSNNTWTTAPVTETWYAGHKMGIALVDSLNTVEGYTPELRFGQAVKGLYVYGVGVIEPAALAVIYTTLT